MVAILIHRICNDIAIMKRRDGRPPNDRSEEDDVRVRGGSLPPPERPPAEGRSRDPRAASASFAATAPPPSLVSASDITRDKTNSFERRDEHRSAFSSLQADEIASAEEKRDHRRRRQQQSTPRDSPPPAPRPARSASREEEPLPYRSPLRYYQQQQQAESGETVIDVDADAPYPYQQYPGYSPSYHQHPSQNPPYDYSGYYNPPPPGQEGTASAMSGSPYHHHPPYDPAGYHHSHQEYAAYPHREYSDPYSYYTSATAASGQQHHQSPSPYSSAAHYSQQAHQQHHYYPESTPPPSSSHPSLPADITLKETPSAVTESTKGATPAMPRRRAGTGGGEGLDLSPSPSPERDDDRKPSAYASGNRATPTPVGGMPTVAPPPRSPDHIDFEPIPLNEIAAIPALSSAAGAPRPSPSPRAAPTRDAYPEAFPPPPPPRPSSAPPDPFAPSRPSAPAAGVAPPAPRRSAPDARRRGHRVLAPSDGAVDAAGGGGGAEGGSWERRYDELLAFRRVHGHCEVPQNYAENTSLGTWVNKQRMEQKNRIEEKNSSLNDSRLERLQRINFRWAKRKGQASWDEKFNELVAYKAKFGNCHVPTKYKDNTALGRWVSTQRAEYKKYQEGQGKTSMNSGKVRRLEGIGFAWFMAL